MSEQEPLLRADPEMGESEAELGRGDAAAGEKGHIARWREHTAEILECRPWHYTVILLARISLLSSLWYNICNDVVIVLLTCTGSHRLCLRASRSRLHSPFGYLYTGRRPGGTAMAGHPFSHLARNYDAVPG